MAEARSAAVKLAPVTRRVLAGEWTRLHLWYAGDAVSGHAEPLAAAAVAAACAADGAATWTPARLKRRIKLELIRLDSETVAERIRARRRERGAHLEPQNDLRGKMSVEGSWETISWAFRQFRRWAEQERDRLRAIRRQDPGARFCCPGAMARLLAHAADGQGDGQSGGDAGDSEVPAAAAAAGDACPFCGAADTGIPTLSELTADAVVAAAGLLAAQLGDPSKDLVPQRGKRWRYAAIVADLPTVVGLADEPGHVPGYGPVPAPIVQELAADAEQWRRFLVDSSGVLLDAGKDSYRPSDRLREHVAARDWSCTFPCCGRSAADADLDHIVNFNGTNTTLVNLHPLCPTHHRVKTHTDWAPARQQDGSTAWASPEGHSYVSHPETPWSQMRAPGSEWLDPEQSERQGSHREPPWCPHLGGEAPIGAAERALAGLLGDPRVRPARAP